MTMTCGEANMRLLAHYGISTVFCIPGVHTPDFCWGLGVGEEGMWCFMRTNPSQPDPFA